MYQYKLEHTKEHPLTYVTLTQTFKNLNHYVYSHQCLRIKSLLDILFYFLILQNFFIGIIIYYFFHCSNSRANAGFPSLPALPVPCNASVSSGTTPKCILSAEHLNSQFPYQMMTLQELFRVAQNNHHTAIGRCTS